jgi:thermitase
VGGGLAGFLGAPSGSIDQSQSSETTLASGSATSVVADQFTQFAITASQALEAERSIVVSTFEESEHRTSTERVFRNDNDCYAVTYYIRRVLEVYEPSTRVVNIEWRADAGNASPFRSVRDFTGVNDDIRRTIESAVQFAPRVGDVRRDHRFITIPTDGTIAETELAYCSSCEPMREAAMRMELEQKRLDTRTLCLQTDAFAQELELGDGVRHAAALAAFRTTNGGTLPAVHEAQPVLATPAMPALAPPVR